MNKDIERMLNELDQIDNWFKEKKEQSKREKRELDDRRRNVNIRRARREIAYAIDDCSKEIGEIDSVIL